MSSTMHTQAFLAHVEELRQLWHETNRAENLLLALKEPKDETEQQRRKRLLTTTTLKDFKTEAEERAREVEDFLSRQTAETAEEALVLATLAAVSADRLGMEPDEELRRLVRLIAELRAYLAQSCGKSTAELGLDDIYGPMPPTWQSEVDNARALLSEIETNTAAASNAA